jgi:hypothetical protein
MHRGREAAEAMLTLVAYTSFMELCVRSKQRSSHFKGFAHRSAGPLWALCKLCLREPADEACFSVALQPLITSETTKLMDAWVSQLPDTKHTRAVEIDYVSFLGRLGNPIAKMFGDAVFGVFENVTAKKFSHGRFRGIFRDLRGHSQTFIHVMDYEGTMAFSDAEIFIVHPSSGTALGLSPLYLWGLNLGNANEEPDLFEFDTSTKSGFSYKAVQLREAKAVTNDVSLRRFGTSWRTCDTRILSLK